jgi:hypothetical protein
MRPAVAAIILALDKGQCRIDEILPGRHRAPASHAGEVAVEFELR